MAIENYYTADDLLLLNLVTDYFATRKRAERARILERIIPLIGSNVLIYSDRVFRVIRRHGVPRLVRSEGIDLNMIDSVVPSHLDPEVYLHDVIDNPADDSDAEPPIRPYRRQPAAAVAC